MQVKERFSDAVFIYIVPPSLTELSDVFIIEELMQKRLSISVYHWHVLS